MFIIMCIGYDTDLAGDKFKKFQALLEAMARTTGGFTISEARDGWVCKEGLVYDAVTRVEVAIQGETVEQVEEKLEAIDAFADQARLLFEQEAIMISRFHSVSTEFVR